MEELIIHLKSNIDSLPIQMRFVQCQECASYFFLETSFSPNGCVCPNCGAPKIAVVEYSTNKDHRFVGWGWEKKEKTITAYTGRYK